MNTNVQQIIEQPYLRSDIPAMEIGDTLRVHTRIREGEKERIQVFEGVLIRWKRGTANSAITVRKISHGIGVERVFPVHSPTVGKIEIKAQGAVRRARLFYLRKLTGKKARIKARKVN
ncbi:MAG: 50S ribosomal protein L19 [Myxococcota bacterium]|nr:50S ribosomal protein L19 [Myxococcota bacterium]